MIFTILLSKAPFLIIPMITTVRGKRKRTSGLKLKDKDQQSHKSGSSNPREEPSQVRFRRVSDPKEEQKFQTDRGKSYDIRLNKNNT